MCAKLFKNSNRVPIVYLSSCCLCCRAVSNNRAKCHYQMVVWMNYFSWDVGQIAQFEEHWQLKSKILGPNPGWIHFHSVGKITTRTFYLPIILFALKYFFYCKNQYFKKIQKFFVKCLTHKTCPVCYGILKIKTK